VIPLFGEIKMRAKTLLLAAVVAALSIAGLAPRAALASNIVTTRETFMPGTIVVHTGERSLYYYVGASQAIRYPVGVGRIGKQWAGTSFINGKYRSPAWSPPAEIRHDKPFLPAVIPGGSPHNPMGVAAMTLAGGEYAIHGTNDEGSIGHFVSYGCIRMHNADINDLYGRVMLGTRVVVER
jgi:lipoprotein-anchoring transpeptidase ErfK/SrfK